MKKISQIKLNENLIRSVAFSDFNSMKRWIRQGADIHVGNDFALRIIAENGNLKVVKYLVERGADVHAGNEWSLRWSAEKGHLEAVKYLVEQGADIHAENERALRWSLKNEHFEVAKYLVDNGADFENPYIRDENKEYLKKYINSKNLYDKFSLELTNKNKLNSERSIRLKL